MTHRIEQYLYMDPETGMVVSMIAEGDGFRPATAIEEMTSIDPKILSQFVNEAGAHGHTLAAEAAELDFFVERHEHSFGFPVPSMA